MPGARGHRIVDGDNRQRADRIAVLLDHIHLRDLFVQRTAGQRDAEHARLERAVFLLEPGRAAILALVVALDAVVRLIERGRQIHARVGELESFAMPQLFLRQRQPGDPVDLDRLHRNQMLHVELVRHLEQNAVVMFRAVPAGESAAHAAYCCAIASCAACSASSSSQRETCSTKLCFGERLVEQRLQLSAERRSVDRRRLLRGHSADGLLLDEFALQRIQRFERVVPRLQRANFGGDPEQLADKILDVRRQVDDQIGVRLFDPADSFAHPSTD